MDVESDVTPQNPKLLPLITYQNLWKKSARLTLIIFAIDKYGKLQNLLMP